MKSTTTQRAFSLAIDALDSELDSSITKINDTHQALKKQHQNLTDRQDAIAHKHGGADIRLSDIIRLNVQGTELFARRDTLAVVKGSRLEALFSGRWENQLLRDKKGRVFMDVNADVFKKILEYLYMVKISNDVPPLPSIDESMKDMFNLYIKFFKLQSSDDNPSNAPDEEVMQNERDTSPIQKQRNLMSGMKRKLDIMEEKLIKEESFVACFRKAKENGIIDNDDAQEVSREEQDRNDEHNYVPNDAEIIDLYLNGEIMAYKRTTLCMDETSKLAKDLGSKEWLKEHTVRTEDGQDCILIEQPSMIFKKLADVLHMATFTDDLSSVPLPSLVDEVDNYYFSRLVEHYFQDNSDIATALRPFFLTSNIISYANDKQQMKEWLAGAGKTEQPKLLYRASRDGWAATDFHRLCDGKGATIVVVKSSAGYIFGGYTDVAWGTNDWYQSSSVSFLYSLKDHAGIGPVKMPIRSDRKGEAVYHTLGHGPAFGGSDFHISSNANKNSPSQNYIGNTYELPANCANGNFLTGSSQFTVSEYEVFLV
eukprot:scaffold3389_cov188-Chaetoceros_neogracile.AAC.7